MSRTTNKRNRKRGFSVEQAAAKQLRMLGLRMVEPIETGWRIIRDRNGKIINAFPVEKVSGDIRAIIPGGTSVLVEVKERDRNLRWSDFEAHQRDALTEHAELGGVSLVMWLHNGWFYTFCWPIPNFGPRKSLSIENNSVFRLHLICQERIANMISRFSEETNEK